MPKRKNQAVKPYKLKSGKKRYMFYIYLGQKGGKKVQTVRRGFKSYDEADEAYKQLAAKDPNEFVKQKQYTLDELYEMWLPFYKRDVKPSTAWKTQTVYKNHLQEHFGSQYVDQITTADIADYFLKLSTTYVNYKPVFWYLRRLFEYAIDLNVLDRNPARSSLLPKKTTKERKDRSHNFYSAEEVKDFLETAKKVSQRDYVYFLILVTTGMRKCEALGLDWNDIEFDKNRIYVQRTTAYKENNEYTTQLPKGNKKRHVPLDDHLAVELKKYRSDLCPKIFHTKEGKYPRPTKAVQWLDAVYSANPDLRRITIHGFRHTFATLMNQSGMNPKDVQAILGHTTVDMTMDVYTHSTEEGREKVRQQINKLF